MKGLLAILLVATFAFAGCTGKSNNTTTAPTTSGLTSTSKTTTGATTTAATTTTGTTASQTSTTSSGPPQDSSHTATLIASVRNGTAPLNVTFSLSATNVDAHTTWALAFGDNSTNGTGSSLPATVPHSYTTAGTKIAQATVTFGDGKTATQSLSIAVLPASTASSDLYNQTFKATVSAPDPATGQGCSGFLPTDAVACIENQVAAANAHGGNKTFFVWYNVAVPAGATSLFVEGGSKAAQTCEPIPQAFTACNPDFDMYLYDPSGTVTAVGTSSDWESGVVDAPAAGTWNVAVVYFAGAPNADATTHIVVK